MALVFAVDLKGSGVVDNRLAAVQHASVRLLEHVREAVPGVYTGLVTAGEQESAISTFAPLAQNKFD